MHAFNNINTRTPLASNQLRMQKKKIKKKKLCNSVIRRDFDNCVECEAFGHSETKLGTKKGNWKRIRHLLLQENIKYWKLFNIFKLHTNIKTCRCYLKSFHHGESISTSMCYEYRILVFFFNTLVRFQCVNIWNYNLLCTILYYIAYSTSIKRKSR